MNDFFDFNNAGERKVFDVIPDNEICAVQMTVKPGGAGQDGWLTRAQDGNSEHLNCVSTVLDGVHAKRKIFMRWTVAGVGDNHAEAIRISREALKAILRSARNIRADDKSETAQAALRTKGWREFDGLRFVVRVGVEPPKSGYPAKNTIKEVITPEHQKWRKVEQVAATAKPTGNAAPAAVTPPANAMIRPIWAGPEQK
jgi:hypothetical protein